MDGTIGDGNRFTALQAGEVVSVLFHGAVEGFAAGEGANLDDAFEFEGFEGAVDGGEAHGLVAIAQFRVEILGGDLLVEGFEALEGALLVTGAATGHGVGLGWRCCFYFRALVGLAGVRLCGAGFVEGLERGIKALWLNLPVRFWASLKNLGSRWGGFSSRSFLYSLFINISVKTRSAKPMASSGP